MKVLEGVTVIDFTQAYSGPYCVMQLADFGARVIKIERAGGGDQSREWTPFKNNYSGYYASVNRNKESISLNMGSEEGQKIIRDLVKNADIVVENFKFGTLEKFGLHYEEMKKINPGLIYASLSGYGQTGPFKKLAAYDNVIQSMAGTMDLNGSPDRAPLRVGPGFGDSFTGLMLANGIVMAYLHKLETGEGQNLNIAMLDTLFGVLENAILNKTVLDQEITRMGTRDASFAPYDVYNCKDGLYTVAIMTDKDFAGFCEVIGKPEMANDLRFTTNDTRLANYEAMTELIVPFFADRTKTEIDALFTAANIPGGMVQDIPEVMSDKQLTAREMFWEIDDPGVGLHTNMANPMKLSAAPATLRNPSPLLGQETDKILTELGYNEADIAAFREKGIV